MDDTGRPNRIHWYKAEPGAQIYAGKHVFSPRIDNLDDDPGGLFELTGKPCPQRRYSQGTNEWGAIGTHVDGDAEDFLGQSLRAKYFGTGTTAPHPCGLAQSYPQGLIVGSRERSMTGHYPPMGIEFANAVPMERVAAGIEFGFANFAPRDRQGIEWSHRERMTDAVSAQGVRFAAMSRLPSLADHRDSNGIAFACHFRAPVHSTGIVSEGIEFAAEERSVKGNPLRHEQGIEFAAEERSVKGNPLRHEQGIEFAADVRAFTSDHARIAQGIKFAAGERAVKGNPLRHEQGLEFAADVRALGIDETQIGQGIEFAADATHAASDAGTFSQGIEFADDFRTIAPPSGSDCESAATGTVGFPMPITLEAFQTAWKRFPITGGLNYRSSYLVASGIVTATISIGVDCATASAPDPFYAILTRDDSSLTSGYLFYSFSAGSEGAELTLTVQNIDGEGGPL